MGVYIVCTVLSHGAPNMAAFGMPFATVVFAALVGVATCQPYVTYDGAVFTTPFLTHPGGTPRTEKLSKPPGAFGVLEENDVVQTYLRVDHNSCVSPACTLATLTLLTPAGATIATGDSNGLVSSVTGPYYSQSVVRVGDVIMLFGGARTEGIGVAPEAKIYGVNATTMEFLFESHMSNASYGVQFAVSGNDVYVFGFLESTHIEKYTLSGAVLSGPTVVGWLPHAVWGCKTAVNGALVYIVGGGAEEPTATTPGDVLLNTFDPGSHPFVYSFDMGTHAVSPVGTEQAVHFTSGWNVYSTYAVYHNSTILYVYMGSFYDILVSYNVVTGAISLVDASKQVGADTPGYLTPVPAEYGGGYVGGTRQKNRRFSYVWDKPYIAALPAFAPNVTDSVSVVEPDGSVLSFTDSGLNGYGYAYRRRFMLPPVPVYTSLTEQDLLYDVRLRGHSLVRHGSCVILAGGEHVGGSSTSRAHAIKNCGNLYNSTAWEYCTTGDLPADFARVGASLVNLNDVLYLFGGTTPEGVAIPAVFKSTDGCASWTLLSATSPPLGRVDSATGTDGTKLFAVGGVPSGLPYVVHDDTVYTSTDGAAWTAELSGLAVFRGQIVPWDADWMFVGHYVGVDVPTALTTASTTSAIRGCPGKKPAVWKDTGSGFQFVEYDGTDEVYNACTSPCPLHTRGGVLRVGNCTSCAGLYTVSTGSVSVGDCMACPALQLTPPDSATSGEASCEACDVGWGGGGESGVCYQCPAGTIPDAISGNCTLCPSGEVPDNGNCTACAAGTYATSGTCSPCASGHVSPVSSSQCTPCAAGTYKTGANTCSGCEPGHASSQGAETCGLCPANTYASPGRVSCTACTGGKTSEAGSDSMAACIILDTGVVELVGVSTMSPSVVTHSHTFDQDTFTSSVHLQSYLLGFAQKVCLRRNNIDDSLVTSRLRINITVSGGSNTFIDSVATGNKTFVSYATANETYMFPGVASPMAGPIADGAKAYVQWEAHEFGDLCFVVGFREWHEHTAHLSTIAGLPMYTIGFDLAYPLGGVGVMPDVPRFIRWDAERTVPPPHMMLGVTDANQYLEGLGITGKKVVGVYAGDSTNDPTLYSVYTRQCLPGLLPGHHTYHEDASTPVLYISGNHMQYPAGLPFEGVYAAQIAAVIAPDALLNPSFVSDGSGGTPLNATAEGSGSYTILVPASGGSSCGTGQATLLRMAWFGGFSAEDRIASKTWTSLGHAGSGQYSGSTLTSSFSMPQSEPALSSSISDPSDIVDVETVTAGDMRLHLSNLTVLQDGRVQFDVYVPFNPSSYTGVKMWYGVAVSDTCMHATSGDFFGSRVTDSACSNYNQTEPDWAGAAYPTSSSDLSSWYWTQPRSDIPVPLPPVAATINGEEYVRYRYVATMQSLMGCKSDGANTFALRVVQGGTAISVYIPVSVSFLSRDEGLTQRSFCHTYTHKIDVPNSFKFDQAAQSISGIGFGVVGVKLDHGTKALCKATDSSFFMPARDASGNIPGQTSAVVDDVCDAQEEGQIARVIATLRLAIPYVPSQGRRGVMHPAAKGRDGSVWQASPRPTLGVARCYGFNATFHSSALSVRYVRNDEVNLLNLFDITISTAYLPFKLAPHATPVLMTDLLSKCTFDGSHSFSIDVPLYSTPPGVEWSTALQTLSAADFSLSGVETFVFNIELDVNPVTLGAVATMSPTFNPHRFVVRRLDDGAALATSVVEASSIVVTSEGDSIGFVVSDSRPETRNFANLYIREVTAIARDQGGPIEADWFGDACELVPPGAGWAADVTPIVFVENFRRVDRFPPRSMPLDGARTHTAQCRADQINSAVLAGSSDFVCAPVRCNGGAGLFNRTSLVSDANDDIPMRDGVLIPTIAVGRGKTVKFCVLSSLFVCPDQVVGGRRLLALRSQRQLLSTPDITPSVGGDVGVYEAIVDTDDVQEPPPLDDATAGLGAAEAPRSGGMSTGEIVGIVFGSVACAILVIAAAVFAVSSSSKRGGRVRVHRRAVPYDDL